MGLPGLYVHIPFCVSRCAYCAFSTGTDRGPAPRYIAALERELYQLAYAGFGTVYVGGGTPSALPTEQLRRLCALLRRLPVPPEAERTVELNPDDVTPELADLLLEAGFNRASLGVQALHDPHLAILGRRHDGARAMAAASQLRRAGFPQLSLDLIYGLPGQSLEQWLDTIHQILELGPDHLSCYELTLEPGTRLHREVRAATLHLPGEEACRRMFLDGDRLLGEQGWCHYEVSSYARSPEHRARHNSMYWTHEPYVGVGAAAHSFDGVRTRWWNPSSVEEYLARVEGGLSPRSGVEVLTDEQLRLERLALGLRTSAGAPLEDAGDHLRLEQAVAAGLLEMRPGRVVPTTEGLLLADHLAATLLGPVEFD